LGQVHADEFEETLVRFIADADIVVAEQVLVTG
jgi:hypothetical protein